MIIVAVPEKKITINDEVQDTFSESSFHKDLSSYLIESAADDEVSSEEVIAVRLSFFLFLNVGTSDFLEDSCCKSDWFC